MHPIMSAFVFPPFYNSDGNLWLDSFNLVDLARKRGTPLLVISEKQIRQNISRITESFRNRFQKFSIRYAVKANPNPSVLAVVRQEGCGVDASSSIEIQLAQKVNFPSKLISFTPNNADFEELSFGVNSGVNINFDDLSQFRLLKKHLPETVSFRVNPGVGGGEYPGITTAGKDSKFGIPPNIAEIGYLEAKNMGCKKFGIHMMAGSNVLDWDHFDRITKAFFEIAGKISQKLNIDFSYLDIGGGFGVPYRPEQGELDLDKAAASIKANYDRANKEFALGSPELIVEPGRFIVANAAVLLGKVTNIKEYDKTFVGSDLGMNILLRPALYGAYHHIVVANKLNEPLEVGADVVGQICENTDRIGKGISLPKINIGDVIAVFNAGAYVSSMSSNYNGRLRPEELLVNGATVNVIKRRETLQDVLRGSTVPRRLMSTDF